MKIVGIGMKVDEGAQMLHLIRNCLICISIIRILQPFFKKKYNANYCPLANNLNDEGIVIIAFRDLVMLEFLDDYL
jgi:hypothetical protein